MKALLKFYPVKIRMRYLLISGLLTIFNSCDTAPDRVDSPEVAEIFAVPNTGRPSISIFPDREATTGQTLIKTFTGETVITQWTSADSSTALVFSPIAHSCASESMKGVTTDRLSLHGLPSGQTQYDIVSPFIRCMESQGLRGEETKRVLPSSFLFGIRDQEVEARYAAEKKGATLQQFKRDVHSCAIPLVNGDQVAVRNHGAERNERVSGEGQLGWYVGSTYHSLAPGGLALKSCMEKLGYAVEDQSGYTGDGRTLIQ